MAATIFMAEGEDASKTWSIGMDTLDWWQGEGTSMRRLCELGLLLFSWLWIGTLAHAQGLVEVDTDHDGLSDLREQALLERFVPRFQVSRADCAVSRRYLKRELRSLQRWSGMGRSMDR
jgi:hypothetical protein